MIHTRVKLGVIGLGIVGKNGVLQFYRNEVSTRRYSRESANLFDKVENKRIEIPIGKNSRPERNNAFLIQPYSGHASVQRR